ncbi:DUF6151 family protein [Marinomonas sp. C2222]|uniref:DUF6151 family protein n=1 Tax=Marinomonas sargassi TaxID=2984494 RepID=A0ABT2YUN3_9GAMM|nr:DUF6151 family protein [Marinomonas sargassi]MCV2403600.1 DUF6151 family protein [Marinomonas sargassi]
MMPTTVSLACSCGEVKGSLKVEASHYFHVSCLCCDCQSFATNLGQAGTILDEHGGTELFQTYPQYLTITEGKEQITCMQLSEKGLFRWHTRCCNTPIGNTMTSANVPFVGIPVTFMKFASEEEKQEALGPVIMKAFGKYAIGDMPADTHPRFPLSFLPKIAHFMMRGFLTKKHSPSPFFLDGQPVVKSNGES